MKVTCPKCSAEYDVQADRVPVSGIQMKCSKCLHSFEVLPRDVAPPAGASDLGLKGVTFLGGQPASPSADEDAGERFFIQRQSGKVFGPFEKRLIVQMLKAGKLVGTESVSRDKSFWVPLSSVAEFEQVLQEAGSLGGDLGNQTYIPGRPGPMAAVEDSLAPLDSGGQSHFDISQLPGLGDEVELPSVDLPAAARPSAQLPASAQIGGVAELPTLAGAELPAPAGFGAQLPAPSRASADLPAPARMSVDLPVSARPSAELPAPAEFGIGAELPASAGFGAELPAPAGLGAELPVPAEFGIGAQLPTPAGMGAPLPAPSRSSAELPSPLGISAPLPAPSRMSAELPAPAGFGGGVELPTPIGLGAELPTPMGGAAPLPTPSGFAGGPELPAPAGARLGAAAELPAPARQSPGGLGLGDIELPAPARPGSGDFFGGGPSPDAFGQGASNVRDRRQLGLMNTGPGAGGEDAELPAFKGVGSDFDGADLFDDASADAFGGFGVADQVDQFGAGAVDSASADFGGAGGFTVEVEDSSSGGQLHSFGGAPSFDHVDEDAIDALPSPDVLAQQQEDAAAAPPPPEVENKKAGKKGKKSKVAIPLAIAIGLLGVALVIVVGLLIVQSGLFDGDGGGEIGETKKGPDIVKPSGGPASFEKLEADTHASYKVFIEETRKELGNRPDDTALKSQLVVAYTLYLAHYPEDTQYQQETTKLAKELEGVEGEVASLGRGAFSVLQADLDTARKELNPLVEGEQYAYTSNLLLGLGRLMEARRPEAAKANREDGAEEKGDEKKEDAEEKDEEEGDEAPAEEGDEDEAPAEEDGEGDKEPAEEDGDGADMDFVNDAEEEDDKKEDDGGNYADKSRKDSLKHLEVASKLKPNAPAPRFFAALTEADAGKSDAARKRLKTALKKSPEHVPSLLEMSRMSYLGGDLNVALDHAKPVVEKLANAASKRERSQAHLMVGLSYVARRQSDKAVEALIESLKIDPSNEKALKALGEEFFRNGKFEEALNYFTTNAGLSKADPEVMLGIVKSHIGLEAFDKAVQVLEGGVKNFPTDARFPFFLGLIHEKEGYWFEAQQRYRASLQIDPDFTKSRVRLALLLLRDGKKEEAQALLEEAEKRGATKDADTAVDIGQAYMLMKEEKKALAALQTALKLNASNLDARLKLARYHLDAGNSKKALDMLKPFMETKQLDVELALLLADAYRVEGQYERSIEQLDRLVEVDPKNQIYLFKRGLAYFSWKNYDTAYDQFLKSYALDPNFSMAYFYAGRVEFERQNYAQAMKMFRAVLDEDPSSGPFRFYLAWAVEKNGGIVQALEEYINIDRFAPNYPRRNPEVFYRRGRLMAIQGNYKKAKRDFKSVLVLDSDHLGAQLALADTLFDENDYEDALVLYNQALAQRDDLPTAHFMRGKTLTLLKKDGEAIAAIEKSIKLGLSKPEAYEKLGLLYKGRGNRGQAVRNFKKYLELSPKASNKKDTEKLIRQLGGTL